MSDDPVPVTVTIPDVTAQQRLDFHKRAQWTVILSMVAVLISGAAVIVLAAGLFRVSSDLDAHIAAIKQVRADASAEVDRAAAQVADLTARLDAASAELACDDEAAAAAVQANVAQNAAMVELVIETAEQFDNVTRGQPADHDEFAGKIATTRLALDAAATANAVYAAALAECAQD